MALRIPLVKSSNGKVPMQRTSGRACETCRHLQRHNIDLELIAGESLRSIADRYGLSHSSVARHKLKCVPTDLIQARGAKKIADADFLLAQICALDRDAAAIFQQAAVKDLRLAIAAIGERRRIAALQIGVSRRTTSANASEQRTPRDYQALRSAIFDALKAHPAAREAVAAALANPRSRPGTTS